MNEWVGTVDLDSCAALLTSLHGIEVPDLNAKCPCRGLQRVTIIFQYAPAPYQASGAKESLELNRDR